MRCPHIVENPALDIQEHNTCSELISVRGALFIMWSSQILILFPFPWIQNAWWLINGVALAQSLIKCNLFFGRGLSRQRFLWPQNYFFHNAICAQPGLGAIILQMTFAPIATFWVQRSLKFKPPSIWGLETLSQLTNKILFSFCLPPFQKKIRMKSSIFLRMQEGASKTKNWKFERLLRTALMSIDLPARLSQEKPQA